MASRPLRLLCLDGGGVKGLTSLLLLREIFRALENEGHSLQPHECFDLIGGTSTGGLIAIMLGRLYMSIDDAIAAYKALSPEIFKEKWWTQKAVSKYAAAELKHYWFEGKNLKAAVQKLVKDRNLNVDLKLWESDDPRCRVFVCAANVDSVNVELLRSYKTKRIGHQNYDCFVWEAVRATSAAPLFFEPVTLEASKATFVDGAIRANNPIDYLMSEARSLWPDREVGCVVSLGTGVKLPQGLGVPKSRLHDVLQTLANIATDSNNKAREFRDTEEGRNLLRNKRYFRYSVPYGVGEVDLADFEKMPYMESMTLPYAIDVDDSIEECARALAGISRGLAETRLASLLPFERNRKFTGRDERLNDLQRMLFVDDHCPRVALAGLGGVGKTQVALELAYRVKAQYSVFWVPALSANSWQQAYAGIARLLDIPITASESAAVAEAVQKHLSRETAGRWLFIIDNADAAEVIYESSNITLSLEQYLPQSSLGSILFTTRNLELATELAGSEVVILDEMSESVAHELLFNLLRDKQLIKEQEATADLLQELTYLPLAITQAAAYINSTNSSIGDYLDLFRDTEASKVALLSREFKDRHRYKEARNPVAATWLVSFERIKRENPLAADILSFMSCLEAKAIPEMALPQASRDGLAFALGTLTAYSFVSKRNRERLYDLHRLVYIATRAWLKMEDSMSHWMKEAICRLDIIFPFPEHENMKLVNQLLSHAQKVLDAKEGMALEERWRLCSNIGYSLYVEGRHKEAVQRCKEVEDWTARSLTENNEVRLQSQHMLAVAYLVNGQITQAVKLLEHVVKIRDTLAEDHPDRLGSQQALAMAYRANGRIAQAVELLEHVVKIKDTLAEDHPDRLASQQALAMAYQANGQVAQPVKLLEHVVKVRKKTLAEDHPDRLASEHALAIAYQANGQIAQAVELLEHVVKVREKTQAEDHPDRLASQHMFAIAYQANGQIAQAVELLEHVVKIQEKTLAEDHPDRLLSEQALKLVARSEDTGTLVFQTS